MGTATVTFTRSDGAELAFVPPRLLERAAGEARFQVVATLEGTAEYRRNSILRIAGERGYLDDPGSPPPAEPAAIRGAYAPKGARRVPLMARRTPDGYEARREHPATSPWHAAATLEDAILAALAPTPEEPASSEAISALAVRLNPRLQEPPA